MAGTWLGRSRGDDDATETMNERIHRSGGEIHGPAAEQGMAAGNDPDALFRRYRREAVLLHRPWPPQAGPPTNSQFGGLPRLPETHAWPRTSSGTPLHFLAQIDCADIRFKTPLPERGVLFFFGRGNAYAWNGKPPASDTCRVLYALDASTLTPPRQPPADLPPLERPATEPDNVHPVWPVVPFRVDTFPEETGLPAAIQRDEPGWRRVVHRLIPGAPSGLEIGADVREAYDEQLPARRAAALVAATGAQPPGKPMTWREAVDTGAAIFDFAVSGPQSFPQHWAYVRHLIPEILDRPLLYALGEETPGERVAEAERWLARSREGPLHRPVAEDDRQAVRAWLASINDYPGLVFRGAVGTIRSWVGDPALAALIPDHVLDACASHFYGYHEYWPRFSQMLGHAPASHQARDVDDPTLCLLNLDTDLALGWNFAGSDGQCTFWITPRDLARRDFSNVEGRLDGR
jgi:hypothetical protein